MAHPVGIGAPTSPVAVALDGSGNLFVVNNPGGGESTIDEGIPSGAAYNWITLGGPGAPPSPNWIAANADGKLVVTNVGSTVITQGLPSTSGYTWSTLPNTSQFAATLAPACGDYLGNPIAVTPMGIIIFADTTANTLEELTTAAPPAPVWQPPLLLPESVTVNGISATVIGNLSYNPPNAVQNGSTVGFVEKWAAIEAGASFAGEGIDSTYLSAILDGSGVGLQEHVPATERGAFAALYQKLAIIPTWTGNSVSLAEGVAALRRAGAPPLAIENYLVQLWGDSWPAAKAQAADGFSAPGL
ncbi:MAG: hypothetical protein OWU84_11480 [Firmicutes bacterium]|nr:hypothetical protein [Bacillota bacterium]